MWWFGYFTGGLKWKKPESAIDYQPPALYLGHWEHSPRLENHINVLEEKQDHEKQAWRALQLAQTSSAQYKTEAQEALFIKQHAADEACEKANKVIQMEKIASQSLKSLEQVSHSSLRTMAKTTPKSACIFLPKQSTTLQVLTLVKISKYKLSVLWLTVRAFLNPAHQSI